MRDNCNKKTTDNKVLYILKIICSISIIIFGGIQILGIWKNGETLLILSLGVLMLIQTIECYKKNRKIDKLSLCATILAFISTILKFVII